MVLPILQNQLPDISRSSSLLVTLLLIILLIVVELLGSDDNYKKTTDIRVTYPVIAAFIVYVCYFIVQQFV